MKIAILGWGPVIYEPGVLHLKTPWEPDGVELPLELCRISGGQRLTLALCNSADPIRSYWALSGQDDLTRVSKNLRQRAKTFPDQVHYVTRDGQIHAAAPENYTTPVARWLAKKAELDAVCWVGLESNWQARRGNDFSVEDALEYLRELKGSGFTDAAERYIRNLPPQNHTRVYQRIEKEFGWGSRRKPERT